MRAPLTTVLTCFNLRSLDTIIYEGGVPPLRTREISTLLDLPNMEIRTAGFSH